MTARDQVTAAIVPLAPKASLSKRHALDRHAERPLDSVTGRLWGAWVGV
jgi:hypothetical protein